MEIFTCDHTLFRFLGGAWWVEMRLHVINGAFPGSPHFISLSTQNEGGGLRMRVPCLHASWSSLHSPSGEGRGQGELSRWCGLPETELVMKKSTKWRSVAKHFWVPGISYSLWYLSISKCDMPPWCLTDSERVRPLRSVSLMRKQWYGTLFSLVSAVSREIQLWYHACPCSSAGSMWTVSNVSTGSCG